MAFSYMPIVSLFVLFTAHQLESSAAATYKATCLYDDAKCKGSIRVRHYEPDDACKVTSCSQVTLGKSSDFAQFVLCPTDIAEDAAALLAGQNYVLVQEFDDGCSGAAEEATAVVADGKCYPQVDGKSSFMVSINEDKSAKWVVYDDTADCTGASNETMFALSDMDGNKCVQNKFKVLASVSETAPKSEDSDNASSGSSGRAGSIGGANGASGDVGGKRVDDDGDKSGKDSNDAPRLTSLWTVAFGAWLAAVAPFLVL